MNFVSSASFAPAPLLRDAMRHLVSGVCIVTAGLGDDPTGMTVTSATSLSIDPPTMIVCINRSSSVWQRIQRYRHFCINILADHHNEIAERFAGRGGLRGAARYAGANWKILETGAPALDGALAAIDCDFESHVEWHTHAVVLGSVRGATNKQRRGARLQPSPIRIVFHRAPKRRRLASFLPVGQAQLAPQLVSEQLASFIGKESSWTSRP